jgi:formiminotetrahydrofolate cyclodeaminase
VIESALKGATTVPVDTALKAREVGDIVDSLRPITNPNMASDLTVAAALAKAAIVGALANVEINLGSIKDADFGHEVRSKVAQLQR